jgi:hypothetical protein
MVFRKWIINSYTNYSKSCLQKALKAHKTDLLSRLAFSTPFMLPKDTTGNLIVKLKILKNFKNTNKSLETILKSIDRTKL